MRGIVFEALNSIQQKLVAPLYRSIGKSLYVAGTKLEGQNASQDRLVPSLRNLSYGDARPELQGANFVAPNATIIGKVNLGLNSSVWYGATLIGTKGIYIGDNCVIQDRTHLSREVKIGNNVFVGPNSIIQGAELADNSFVSMGATVRHAKVESGSLVAAGAVLADNTVVKQGEIWAGNPAKFLRNITPVQRQVLREHLQQMRDLAAIHSQENEKSFREVISDRKQPYESNSFSNFLDQVINDDIISNTLNYSDNDEQFIERRTLMRESVTLPEQGKDYEAYQYNVSHMGQKFNLGVHKQQFNKIATKLVQKQRFNTDQNPWTKPY